MNNDTVGVAAEEGDAGAEYDTVATEVEGEAKVDDDMDAAAAGFAFSGLYLLSNLSLFSFHQSSTCCS